MPESNHIDILLNGKPHQASDGWTIRDLVRHLGLQPGQLAVEVNRSIVRRSAWQDQTIQQGD